MEDLKYSREQTIVLVLLRLIVGYHFLFEGIDKLFSPNWTSAHFLLQTDWILSGFFHYLASSEMLLSIVDVLNIWGQILIGISLITGLFSYVAALCGALMLLFYYLAIPPFIESHIFIDKNLLELFALIIIALFPTSRIVGIDLLLKKFRSEHNG